MGKVRSLPALTETAGFTSLRRISAFPLEQRMVNTHFSLILPHLSARGSGPTYQTLPQLLEFGSQDVMSIAQSQIYSIMPHRA